MPSEMDKKQALVNHAVLILGMDEDITVLQMDPVFEWRTGIVKEWKNEAFLSLLAKEDRTGFAENYHRQCRDLGIVEQEYCLTGMDGKRRCFLMTGYKMEEPGHEGMVKTYHMDITRLRMEQRDLPEEEYGAETLMRNHPGGFLRLALSDPTRVEFVSDSMYRMAGYTEKDCEKTIFRRLGDFIDPRDWERVTGKLAECRLSEEMVEFECRIITRQRQIKWIHCRCRTAEDKKGVRWIYTAAADITDFKRTQEALKQERDRLRVILGLYRDQIFEYDRKEDTLLLVKGTYPDPEQDLVIGNCRGEIERCTGISERDRKKLIAFFEAGEPFETEYRYSDKDGNAVWYQARCNAIADEAGTVRYLIGCIRNIDSQKTEKERLLWQTRRDGLTGLYNRNYAQELIGGYLDNEAGERKQALLLADIEGFIRINERLGRLFGNSVLSSISDKIIERFRGNAIIGRTGGQLLIFLQNPQDTDTVKRKAEMVIEIINKAYAGEGEERLSCCIGISIYPEDGRDFSRLCANAEKALYQAKSKGSNRLLFYRAGEEAVCEASGKEIIPAGPEEGPDEGFREFNMDIVTFAFDIMAKTKDVGSALTMLLSKVGRQFGAGFVILFERKGDEPVLLNTYQWYCEGIEGWGRKKYRLPLDDAGEILKRYDENGIFVIEDCRAYIESEQDGSVIPPETKMRSMLQCAMIEDEEIKGCLVIADCTGSRKWKNAEINSLVMITKLISSYLLKMRLSAKMLTIYENRKNYDELTGLPTLHKFKKDAKSLLIRYPEQKFALICSDICNFKYINDTYGYKEGDKILREFAKMITAGSMSRKCVSRMVSDNFMALVSYENEEQLRDSVLEINNRFNSQQKRKKLNSNLVVISGVSVVNPEEDIMVAIDNANLARKFSKNASKTVCRFYTPKMKEQITYEAEILNSMEEALENGEFKLYLQPKYRLSDDSMIGAEALVRWVKEDGNIIPPDRFVPIFEKNGFIIDMDFYIYEQVCRFLRMQLDRKGKVVPVSVNVSRAHLNDEQFVRNFVKLTSQYQLPPALLELELTESVFLDKSEEALSMMHRLRSLGYSVSIDDFGSGYSSLNLLKDIETDILKLDKEFFRQGEMKKEEKIIVSSIIGMAKQLNLKVLSEGVETRNQMNFLKGISCDMAQGYLYAKPMPTEEFLSRMNSSIERILN